MLEVASTNSEIHDLAHTHEDSFECGLIAGSLDRKDVADDQWRGDLVDLLASQGSDDMIFEASSLFSIGHDATFFQAAPQPEGIVEYVSGWRFEACIFATPADDHPGLLEAHLRPMADGLVCDAAGMVGPENPGLGSGWLNAQGKTVAVCYGVARFAWF